MTWRNYAFIFLINLAVLTGVASFQSAPGYMDADYYTVGAIQLASGRGFTEPILWNYLDSPDGIPHPSHAYWMPLASMIGALGIKLTGNSSFEAVRLPFILLASLVAPLTAWFTYSISKQKRPSLLAGWLAIFSGFYLPRMTTVDTFPIVMILGVLFLQALYMSQQPAGRGGLNLFYALFAGSLAGLIHLARADGLVWLAAAILAAVWFAFRIRGTGMGSSREDTLPAESQARRLVRGVWMIAAVAAGYLLFMGPWMVRNEQVFGSLLSPGGQASFWLTNYNDLFSLHPEKLTLQYWVQSGLGSILQARWDALVWNLQTILVIQGGILLVPLTILGVWRHIKDLRAAVGLMVWGMIGVLMTLVFPFAGSRGGLFHSAAALQPLFWAMAALGLGTFVDWGRRKRSWQPGTAYPVFAVGLVVLMLLISGAASQRVLLGSNLSQPVWNQPTQSAERIGQALLGLGATQADIILTNNPPGFYYAVGIPAVVIPDGKIEVLEEAAERYEATYLVLEENHPAGLDALYENPVSQGSLIYLQTVGDAHIFEIEKSNR